MIRRYVALGAGLLVGLGGFAAYATAAEEPITTLKYSDCPRQKLNKAAYTYPPGVKGKETPEAAIQETLNKELEARGLLAIPAKKIPLDGSEVRFLYFSATNKPFMEVSLHNTGSGWIVESSKSC